MKKLGPSDTIVFLGDSITEQGGEDRGYVTLVSKELRSKYGQNSPAIINAGISGNRVTDLQSRLESDVLLKKPSVVVVYIGINDVWHFASPGSKGTSREGYELGLKDVISRIINTGASVILCTPSVIGERRNGENAQDSMLDEYAEISRKIAGESGVMLCDLHNIFIKYLFQHNTANAPSKVLTTDGVHLNDEGNALVARSIMKFF